MLPTIAEMVPVGNPPFWLKSSIAIDTILSETICSGEKIRVDVGLLVLALSWLELKAPDAIRGEEMLGGLETDAPADTERELVMLGPSTESAVIRLLRVLGPPGREEVMILSRDVKSVN
jgi:hypothetical protein